MYLLTHSLLSSWQWMLKDNPFEDDSRDYVEEFRRTLRRERIEPTEPMLKGRAFENAVVDCISNPDKYDRPYTDIAEAVRGAQAQVKVSKEIEIEGEPFLLYGVLDFLKAGVIIDTKYTSKPWTAGKYYDSTQHPMYFSLVPDAYKFTYIISDERRIWLEEYWRKETKPIELTIVMFIAWLKQYPEFNDLYRKHWEAH